MPSAPLGAGGNGVQVKVLDPTVKTSGGAAGSGSRVGSCETGRWVGGVGGARRPRCAPSARARTCRGKAGSGGGSPSAPRSAPVVRISSAHSRARSPPPSRGDPGRGFGALGALGAGVRCQLRGAERGARGPAGRPREARAGPEGAWGELTGGGLGRGPGALPKHVGGTRRSSAGGTLGRPPAAPRPRPQAPGSPAPQGRPPAAQPSPARRLHPPRARASGGNAPPARPDPPRTLTPPLTAPVRGTGPAPRAPAWGWAGPWPGSPDRTPAGCAPGTPT